MKYKFENFKGEITDPLIKVVSIKDNMDGTCIIGVELESSGAKFGLNLTGFTYSNDWNKSEVSTWVDQKLLEYTSK